MVDRKRACISISVIVLFLGAAACSLTGTATPTPASETITAAPVSITPTPTPTSSLPVVASPQIVSFDMLDMDNGWALSDTNVLRTTDGGSTWYNITPSGVTDLGPGTTAFYLDMNHAWMVIAGSDFTSGTLFRTSDGGLTWSSTPVPFSGGSLKFLDPSSGWVLAGMGAGAGSEGVAVFNTIDGGNAWTRVFVDDPTVPGYTNDIPLVGDKSGLTFLDARHGWVAGEEPVNDLIYLYATTDGGRAWAPVSLSVPSGYTGGQENTDPPVFFDGKEGVLPVGIFAATNATVLYLSHDGGVSWSASTPVSYGRSYSITSPLQFFVWDGGPTLHVSADAGATWTDVTTNVNFPDTLLTFQFVDATTGWALTGDATPHYTFYKTTDGGATWNVLIP